RPTAARYAGMVLLSALALLAKPMAVTLPFTLLLLDFWPLRRFDARSGAGGTPSVRRILLEKAAPAMLAIAAAIIAIYTQRGAGMMLSVERRPVSARVENAIVAYATYLAKTIWPSGLAVFYPLPGAWPSWQLVVSAAVLLAISAAAIRV